MGIEKVNQTQTLFIYYIIVSCQQLSKQTYIILKSHIIGCRRFIMLDILLCQKKNVALRYKTYNFFRKFLRIHAEIARSASVFGIRMLHACGCFNYRGLLKCVCLDFSLFCFIVYLIFLTGAEVVILVLFKTLSSKSFCPTF